MHRALLANIEHGVFLLLLTELGLVDLKNIIDDFRWRVCLPQLGLVVGLHGLIVETGESSNELLGGRIWDLQV